MNNATEFTDFLGNSWVINCLGCAIGQNTITPPFGMIYETTNFVVHQDPLIPLKGFLVIASKKHHLSLLDITNEQNKDLWNIIYHTRKSLTKIPDIKDVTIIQEEHSSHFHVWIFPWYRWMLDTNRQFLSSIRKIMNKIRDGNIDDTGLLEIKNGVELVRTYFNSIQ